MMKFMQKMALLYLRIRFSVLAAFSVQKAAQRAFDLFCSPQRNNKAQEHSEIISRAELISFRMNELTIRGYRWNKGAARRVLIAHGFESAARNFEGLVTPLEKSGFEIVAFDAPGHGRSDGNEINLPLYIQFLHRIWEEFGPFDAYIGHSFGGLAIPHLLESIPYNANTRIVLIAPATETTTAINRFFGLLRLNGKVRMAFEKLVKEKSGVAPEHFSVRRAVRKISCPILWLHDAEDDVTPYSDAEKVKNDQHPNIQFIISNGLGHSRIYRNEQTINHILHFL